MLSFSNLIGRIYDAVLDPSRWPEVLGEIGTFVHSSRTLLILEDAVDPQRSVAHLSFDDEAWYRRYIETYLLINPMRLATIGTARAGQIIFTTDFMSTAAYRRTPFYREFMAERGMADVAAAVLEKTATTITVLSLLRSLEQGPADAALRRRLEAIVPHVWRASSISRALEHARVEAHDLAAALDRLSGAVFLLDAACRVVHANDAARVLLEAGDVVRIVDGRLVAPSSQARLGLAEALRRAAEGDVGGDAEPPSLRFVDSGGGVLFGSVLSLVSGDRRRAGLKHRAVAALFVRAVEQDLAGSGRTLADVHGLTPREAGVLVAIAEIGGVPKVASVLGLSEATVRTHLKAIYQKTGTHRQAELVRLLAAAAPPAP